MLSDGQGRMVKRARRVALWVLSLVSLADLLLSACGSGIPVARAPGTVSAGNLSTSTTHLGRNLPAHIAEVPLSFQGGRPPFPDPPLSATSTVVTQAQAESASGFTILHMPNMGGFATVFASADVDPATGRPPDLAAPKHIRPRVHLTYLPATISVNRALAMSEPGLIAAGALEITVVPAYMGPIPDFIQRAIDRQTANGQIVIVDVQGERAGVQRLAAIQGSTEIRVGFAWTNSAGRREAVALEENRAADDVLQLARSLTEGQITTTMPSS